MRDNQPKPVRQHAFRQLLDRIHRLSPRQVEDVLSTAKPVRQRREALAEIEARTERERKCPHCGCEQRQKWGATRTGVQRFRCGSCKRSYSGMTHSRICGLHRPDLFLEAIRDMMSDRPLSCRKLGARLGLTKDTIWRWRMIVLKALSAPSGMLFAGIVEVDETYQRESRKGSRGWVRHRQDPKKWPQPPRQPWRDYKSGRLKMLRGLSRWQLPLLTVADRGGHRVLRRIPDVKDITIEASLVPILAPDAVLCTDRAPRYAALTRKNRIEHFMVSNAPGRRLASPAHHIQNVNAMHARYKEFIRQFRGPASKYLDRYLRWFLLQRQCSPIEVFGQVA